jgi:hypothetical protein
MSVLEASIANAPPANFSRLESTRTWSSFGASYELPTEGRRHPEHAPKINPWRQQPAPHAVALYEEDERGSVRDRICQIDLSLRVINRGGLPCLDLKHLKRLGELMV